jgi:heat shock protein HslJ
VLTLQATLALASGAPPVLEARGHEPSWHLRLADGRMVIEGLAFPGFSAAAERAQDGKITASDGARRAEVAITERPCADSMTGMPSAVTVTLTLDGRTMPGCGGTTRDFLQGGWRILTIHGQPVLPQPPLTMTFENDRVFGSAGCNRFTGGVTLTGEGLRIGQAASTMMACVEPGLAEQEGRFHGALPTITRAGLDGSGRLTLLAGDTVVFTLDRAR